VAYAITSAFLQRLRMFLQGEVSSRAKVLLSARETAIDLLAELDHVDGLDAKRLHELATWAREQARAKDKLLASAPPGETERVDAAFGSDFTGNLRRKQAETARIIEVSTDVLTALALDKLPPGAVLNIGGDGTRVNGSTLRWPNAEERALTNRLAAVVEDAANEKPSGAMSREQVEALPSHDRAVLSRIFGELLGEPGSGLGDESAELVWDEVDAARAALADSLGAPLLSTWPDIIRIAAERCPQGTTWRNAMELAGLGMTRREGERLRGFETEISKLLGMPRSGTAEMFEVLQRALNRPTVEASRYSLPEFHPLRLYQWAEWLRRMLAADELASDAGFGLDVNGRLEWLRAALERVEALDVNGLRGLVELAHDDRELSPLSNAENRLLLFACGCGRLAQLTEGKSFIGAGCHRIPRVRGETVEVGK
jgi:hypothetical protein